MSSYPFVFSGLFFVIFLATFFYAVVKVVRLYRQSTASERQDVSQVSFVVNTFHELVAKLKEKEKELEMLRSKAENEASSIGLYSEHILQSVPSGVVSFDEMLVVTKINAAALKTLDMKAAEVVGKRFDEVFDEPLSDYLRRKRNTERTEFLYVTRSGRRIWLGMNLSPLADGEGKVIGQILVFTDITELRALQSQMELRDRLSTLGEMSAGIAHELRNPMAVISGYTKLLSKKVDPSLLPAVEAVSAEVSVMDRIISDFLSFAKPAELVRGDVDMAEIIEGCIQALGTEGRPHIVFRSDLLPIIRGDEVLLRQAVANLLQNALEAGSENSEVVVEATAGRDRLTIVVRDQGHGIPEAIVDKIFLPFFTTKERGTGLGLSIVHKIVVAHDGSIGVESAEGGTVFTISLPIGD